MKLTIEIWHHTLTINLNLTHDDGPDSPDLRDTTLDALVERAGGDRDPKAEMDQRTRFGFRQ